MTSAGGAEVIRAGEDCWIEAINIRSKRTGQLIDVTGFQVHAAARALYERYVLGRPNYIRATRWRMMTPVVAEWSTTPTGTQGTVIAGGTRPNVASLHVTPEQTSGWRCPLVIVQAEMVDPVTGYKARIIDKIYEVSFDCVSF